LQSILLKSPIIAVNINYRLGIFGFAASSAILQAQPSSGIQGCNFGLRDQKVGISWISKNISAFGGDPTKITVGGQSAGGASTQMHVLDAIWRKEKPLFRHACIQSGAIRSILGPMTMTQANHHWEALCENLGLKETPTRSMLHELLVLNTEALLQATRELQWFTFALVEDERTISVQHRGPETQFVLDLGDVSDEPKIYASENINILIGDTEDEVRMGHKIGQHI
jgi:carboxylesterase type B